MKGIEELGAKWKIMPDNNEKRILTDKLEIVILEIPKAKRILEKDKNNEIAQWLMFLDNPNSVEVSKIMGEIITNMLKNGIIKEQIASMTGISIQEIEELLETSQ